MDNWQQFVFPTEEQFKIIEANKKKAEESAKALAAEVEKMHLNE